MPQFNQSKPYYNLFDFTANLLRWAINNPLQFIVSALALQAIIASAKSSEGLTSERKSRNLAFASNDAVALQESGPWPYYFAGATLSNNRTVISYIPFVGSQDPKFRLFDANFNPVSETKQVSLTSGLLSITIPLENGGFSLINGVGGGKYIRYNSLGTAQIGPSQVGAYGYETIWSATRLTNDSIAVLLTHGNCIYGLTWVLVDTDSSPYYTKDYPVLATCDNVRTASIQKISNQRLAVLYREAEAGTEGLYMKAYDETSGNELIRQRVDLSSSTYKICSPAPANYHMFPYTALSSFGDGKTAIAWLCGETETAQICLRIMESDLSLSPTIQKLKISWTHNGLYLTTLLNGGFAAAWWKPYYDYRTSTSQDKLTVHHFNRTGSLVGAFAIPAAGYDFSYHSHIALVPNQPNQIEVFWSNGFSHQRFDLSASSQVMQLANPIPNQVTRSRTTYTYEVPLDTFSMPNLDQDLTYSVSPLPAWLEFDAQSQTFVGFPADADVANYPISLFARDNFGSEANATFNLNVKRFNRAPTVNALIPNRSGKVGLPFNYTVPSSVFSDADGDSLRYNASRADNSSLPVWLNFNTTSRRFSGVPAKQSEGLTDIKVIAEDDYDGSAFDIFTLDIASSLSAEMPAQNGGYIGRSFNLTGLTVASESSNNIAVQLSLSDLGAGGLSTPAAGTAISSFDADAGIWTVSGLPADVQAVLSQLAYLPASGYSGSFTINALIDDGINNVLTRSLTLGQRPNTAPVVAGSLANQEVTVGSALALTLPNGLFTDADSDQLTYSAALSNGNPLPSWLSFNPDTLHFSGSPQVSHVAELAITITATDIAQASSQFTFGLNVIMPAASASATATASATPSPGSNPTPSAAPSIGSAASPSPNFVVDTNNNQATSNSEKSLVTTIATSIAGAVGAGFVGLAFWAFRNSKEAAIKREQHPFANRLRSALNLNINSFSDDKGIEFVQTIDLLIKAFGAAGLDVAHFTIQQLNALTPIAANEIRNAIELNSGSCGRSFNIASMVAFHEKLPSIAQAAATKYRANTVALPGATALAVYSNPIDSKRVANWSTGRASIAV